MSQFPQNADSELEPESEPETPSRRGLIYAISLTAIFIILGSGFTLYAFPELSVFRAIVAGVCFGGFLGLCSITYSAF